MFRKLLWTFPPAHFTFRIHVHIHRHPSTCLTLERIAMALDSVTEITSAAAIYLLIVHARSKAKAKNAVPQPATA